MNIASPCPVLSSETLYERGVVVDADRSPDGAGRPSADGHEQLDDIVLDHRVLDDGHCPPSLLVTYAVTRRGASPSHRSCHEVSTMASRSA
jgi:hypothetical protein